MGKSIVFGKKTRLLIVVLLLLLPALSLRAQTRDSGFQDLWTCPVADYNLYSASKAAFGYGFALGAGADTSLGLRVLYCQDPDKLTTLEITSLMRVYLSEDSSNSGFFVQLNAGPVLFYEEYKETNGTFCIGLSLGWRYLVFENWFIEGAARTGFPFIVGAGISLGFRY